MLYLINIRNIAQGGLLICLSAILQLLPTSFGEIFIIASILSSIPIYILSRINPKVGLIGYIITGILIFLFNAHEGLFFLFTNGPVGFALGNFNYKLKSKLLISLLSGIVLTLSLCIVNFIVGIPVLGNSLPGNLLTQIGILMVFSILYCFIYLLFANFIYIFLEKRYPFN
ncbi:MAG: hypothetical protein K0Q97_2545 [Bacillota bacterium]|nr:hypothetical protein [Bacillota bacterium]